MLKIQNRDTEITSDGKISIKKSDGNTVIVGGKVLSYDVVVQSITPISVSYGMNNYRVVANGGITKDITGSDANKLISFVDTGSPTSIKRQNAGILEPSITLYKVREISSTGNVTNFDVNSQLGGSMSTLAKVGIIAGMAGLLYVIYRKYIRTS